jgi:acetylornithine/N-succinyldiaminopimelate aminotransferase
MNSGGFSFYTHPFGGGSAFARENKGANMDTTQIIQNGEDYLLGNVRRIKNVFMRGEGPWLYDSERGKYLDFFAGIAVNALGQAAPEIVEAVTTQIKKIGHVSNWYYNEPSVRLAKLLCEISFAQKVFLCNSGTEANEAALKLARKFYRRAGQDKYEIISFHRSFHGRTYGSLSATGNFHYHEGFEPMVFGFHFAHYNDLESVKKLVGDKTAAVIIELVQCEGGMYPADVEFVRGLRELTREKNILLIVDEVQTGVGRTGKMWAYEHYGIEPDVMTVAKALGGGLPIGAMLVTNRLKDALQPGDHASTFGGNPICCAAAIATVETIIMKNLVATTAKYGDFMREKLEDLRKKYPEIITDVRGMGFLQAIEVSVPSAEVLQACARQGLLVGAAGSHVVRVTPPLIVTKADIELAMDKMDKALSELRRPS